MGASGSTNKNRREWDQLEEWKRNCLNWPDLQEWGDLKIVKINKNKAGGLGIISGFFQNPDTKVCYNIIKQVTEGKPASGKVEQCDWIVAVNEESTTEVDGDGDLRKLITDAGDEVCLTIRKPINPLKNIKRWSKDELKLELPSKDLGFSFSHFYSEGKKDKIEDRILVIKVESSGLQLQRGDELLSVNGTPLNGKKMKDINDLINISAKVVILFNKILPVKGEEFQECLNEKANKSPDETYRNPQNRIENVPREDEESSLGSSQKSNPADKVCHIVSEVDDGTPVSRANLCVGDHLLSVNDHDLTNLEEDDATELVLAAPGGSNPLKRGSSINSQNDTSHISLTSPNGQSTEGLSSELSDLQVSEIIPEQENDTGCETQNGIWCGRCRPEEGEIVSRDKRLWPINKIDRRSFEEICSSLDDNTHENNIFMLADIMKFPPKEIGKIEQEFELKGGIGAAKVVLKRWTSKATENNVGKLRELVGGRDFKRVDVVELIDEWVKKENCLGCGARV